MLFDIQVAPLQYILHYRTLVCRIEDGEAVFISEIVDVAAQYAHAHRVECGDPYVSSTVTDECRHAVTHLAGRLVGESDGQYVPCRHIPLCHQIGDTVREYTCLPAACTRHYEQRAFGCPDGPLLFFIH